MNILLVEQHVREFEILFCLDNAVFSFRYLSEKKIKNLSGKIRETISLSFSSLSTIEYARYSIN